MANEVQWNNDYVALRAAGGKDQSIESRHRHPEIKVALIEEAADKCIYCEEKITSSQFGDVEHILPKSLFPHLYASWENLALACERCNNAKSNNLDVVNPYQDDPADFISFVGPMLLYDSLCPIGFGTVRGLKLNRTQLMIRRANAIDALVDKIDRWAVEAGAKRLILEEEILESIESESEFAGTLRAMLTFKDFNFD